MRPRTRALAVLAAAALTAAGSVACGSSGHPTVSPAAYVKAVCGAVAPFERDVVSRSSALNLATFSNPVQGKNGLEAFLAAVAADAGRALSSLERAGTPNVTNGSAISAAVVNAFARLEATMRAALVRARALPTSSASALRKAARELSTSVRSSLASFPSLSSRALRSPEIDLAAAREPACRSRAGG
jgi:hypothetical protein